MALQINATGINVATSGVSAGGAIPVDSGGTVPRLIRVSVTTATYVRVGTGAQTAVSTDMMVHPAESVIVPTLGRTHIAGLQVTSAGVMQVSPVEDV
jgi:hypothetical protein